jgi:eukaryotic-like serine/threonine-protein kinase
MSVALPMPPTNIGKFQVLGKLGAGAHSSILHIRRAEDSKAYALKVVPIEGPAHHKFLEQAEHEYRVAQMLEHPNLIKVYCIEKQRNWLFKVRKVQLLIEFVNGKTIDQTARLTLPRMVQLLAKVANGLVHMHRRGVFHADLKPNNIMLSKTGDVKVIDYGLAWIKGEAKGRVQGTPEYMAPEQSRKSIANEKTDIYNFGATMYRLITWKLPPSTLPKPGSPKMTAELFENLLRPVKELTPQAPEELCTLIHRCLAFNHHKRPDRMTDVLDKLDALTDMLVRRPEDRLEALGDTPAGADE